LGTRLLAISRAPGLKGRPARLELALLDPQVARDLGIVAANLLDEALGVLATGEHLELDAERGAGEGGVIDDWLDDHCRRS
jgi:hypothetical protein